MTVAPSYLLDTNILLRFLQGDHAKHSGASKKLFERARKGELILEIPFVSIIEALHTLRTMYKVGKERAVPEILKVLNTRGVRTSAPNWILDAFDEFLTHKVSFGDACIAAEARASGIPVASFDKDFDLLADVNRFEPK